MKIKKLVLPLLLLALAFMLSGCRFAVVESDTVRIEAPTPSPTPQAAEGR